MKANSEGQPGPQDYGRTHADGANMLADALAPHGGLVMWRAFVYSESNADDRAKQAFKEFTPLDGRFRSNVLLQIKNGAIDFQPREPFHPLFGAMPRTPVLLELQVTKEYLGFATHLVYLAPLFEEVLSADTRTGGSGPVGSATWCRARRAWPTPAPAATGAAPSSRAPTGTPSGAWRGTRASAPRRWPRSGCGRRSPTTRRSSSR